MTPTPPSSEPPIDPASPEEAAAPAPKRRWLRRRETPGPAAPAEAIPADAPAPADGETAVVPAVEDPADPEKPSPEGPRRLRRRRKKLVSRREVAVYDLGGLAFELYRRDMLTEEVMRLRAQEVADLDDTVRDIDARLSQVDQERRERRVRTPPDPSVGCCLVCRAPFRAEARFCWQCGTEVVPLPPADDQPTIAITSPSA